MSERQIIEKGENPLGYASVGTLLRKFAIPSIISMLVGSVYNMVDQFFIGQRVGELGNAATNIAFPLSMLCTGTALLFGIGGASAFNISLGEGEKEEATHYMGNALAMIAILGTVIALFAELFLRPMLLFFGSPDTVLPYAMEYTRITAIGFPALLMTIGGGHMVRADGRPTLAMTCNLSGAILNTILDALFVFVLDWGMFGAAFATVIGQYISAILAINYLRNCKTVQLHLEHFKVRFCYVKRIISLGMANFFNQIAMMFVQIILNNSLKYYGARSVYGESIPIACVGIISKVNMSFMSFIIGLSQGLQPIASFNTGAKNFGRVKEAYRKAVSVGAILAIFAFAMFQIFPRQITSVFGDGSPEYYAFAVSYFRIYLFCVFLNFLQPITSNFFTAIGQPKKGIFLSLTRQILFLVPLILVFPLFFGIDGIMYAGPVADGMAAVAATLMILTELRKPHYRKPGPEQGSW